jgi:acylphosphatase
MQRSTLHSACRIELKGNFAARGFGFSCLKQAAQLKLAGSLQYQSEEQVLIQIYGSDNAIEQFFKWCQGVEEVRVALKRNSKIPSLSDHEFQIINYL